MPLISNNFIDFGLILFVMENVPWYVWKNVDQREDMLALRKESNPNQIENEATMELVWFFYFKICFLDEALPSDAMSCEEAFYKIYDKILEAIPKPEEQIFLPDPLWGDAEMVLQMIAHGDELMQHASSELKGDQAFAMQAVSVDLNAFRFLSESLQTDREVIEAALRYNSRVFYDLPDEMKNDRALILIALNGQESTSVFEILPEQFLDDKEIILLMVSQDGLFLQCASDRLRRDKAVIDTAIAQNPDAKHYAIIKRLRLFDASTASRMNDDSNHGASNAFNNA
ncbi:MAG: DUF4116 domain-containing protein [Legionella sp.]|nr:DUF4116 domain-containing protein [Legionella sp.]